MALFPMGQLNSLQGIGGNSCTLAAVGVKRSLIFQILEKGTLRATPSAEYTLQFFPSYSGWTRAVSWLQTATLSFFYPAWHIQGLSG